MFAERGIVGGQMEKGAEELDGPFSIIDRISAESTSAAELRDQLLNVLLAGRDTAACCLSWAL